MPNPEAACPMQVIAIHLHAGSFPNANGVREQGRVRVSVREGERGQSEREREEKRREEKRREERVEKRESRCW